MWAVIYLCAAVHGELHCVKIREVTPPTTRMRCESYLHYFSWLTVYVFKKRNPQFRDYKVIYKECTSERPSGQDT